MQNDLKRRIELLREQLNKLLDEDIQDKEEILKISKELDKLIHDYYLK